MPVCFAIFFVHVIVSHQRDLALCVFLRRRQGAAFCSSLRCCSKRCEPCGETDKRCDASCEGVQHLQTAAF